MDKLYKKYSDQVEFFTIYIREAHPIDGWRMSSNDQFGIRAALATSDAERTAVATECCSALEMMCPMLVDTIDDKVASDYAAFPDRMYIVDADGRVAYKGGRGPIGFMPAEMEQTLILLLMNQEQTEP